MLSYTTLTNKCITYASDAGAKTFFQAAINEGQKIVENELSNFVTEDQRTGNTIAGFSQVPTPENYLRAKFFYVTSSPSRYDARFIYSEEQWQRIVAFQQSVKSNYIEYVFPRLDYIELYPTPSTSLPYTFQYVSESRDMQYDDYTTGTISTITNTVPASALPYATWVGTGTTWIKTMAGLYIQMTGDRQWYKITSITDGTDLVTQDAYNGIAIGGFADKTYTIAEMPRIPEASHILLYYYAMKEYYLGLKKDTTKGQFFDGQFTKWLTWAKGTYAGRTEMGVIPSQRNLRRYSTRNPNLFPMTIG